MAVRKTSEEWSRIEHEYLSGDDSIREIADRHEISEAAIRKRAKLKGWERPVRTRQPVRTLLPAPRIAIADPVEVREPIDAGKIAENARQLVARMLDELDAITSFQGELEESIEIVTANDENDARRDAMMKAVSLPARSQIVKNLAASLKVINETAAPTKGK
ncbi:hypothetical protein, partial [Sphingomonas sp. PP-CE-1G-424]|uniref:hypothetical protein n=1 Tax=Sphingomonas sp. PP-CE-1G-424 TaxID=2135658 RepID=UPI00105537AE